MQPDFGKLRLPQPLMRGVRRSNITQSIVKNLFGLILLVIAPHVMARDINLTCVSIQEQLATLVPQDKNLVLLLDSAFSPNECATKSYWSISDAVISTVEGFSLVHGAEENIDQIKVLSKKNRNVIEKAIPSMVLNSEHTIKGNFSDSQLNAFTISFSEYCKVSLQLGKSRNKRLWLFMENSVPLGKFCVSASTIYASYFVRLVKDGYGIVEDESN